MTETADEDPPTETQSSRFLKRIEFLTGEDPNAGWFLLVVGVVTCVFVAVFQCRLPVPISLTLTGLVLAVAVVSSMCHTRHPRVLRHCRCRLVTGWPSEVVRRRIGPTVILASGEPTVMTDARLSHISVYPVKGLDAVNPDRVAVTAGGGLTGDRVYALYDDEGYLNARRTAAFHPVASSFDLDAGTVQLSAPDRPAQTFDVDADRAALETWLGEHLGTDVELQGGRSGEQSDRAIYGDGSQTGPTLVSEATLRELASWFDGIDPEGMRRRLRPNLVVSGVNAFWEERLLGSLDEAVYADGGTDCDARAYPRVRIGDVTLEGVEPIPRCVVPTRDPDTGEEYDGFRETFVRRRAETLPSWTDEATLAGNLYSATLGTHIPEGERDGDLVVGEAVALLNDTE